MKNIKQIVPFFILAVLLMIIFYYIDAMLLNGRYYNKVVYGADCNYVVPNGYKIVFGLKEKKYAVADLSFQDYYLYNTTRGITPMFSSISIPCLFDDTCGAKAYLKAYLKNQQPKFIK